jgi:mono/diheme cytochrome c family protein
MLKNVKNLLALLIVSGAFLSMIMVQDAWVVPDEYKNMKNPLTADQEVLDLGKTLYNQHCRSCHGKDGLGDGPKAAQLETPAGDFSAPEFQEQSDGTLLYKSWIGRDEMPNYEKKIPDKDDMWAVIHYMRTFK